MLVQNKIILYNTLNICATTYITHSKNGLLCIGFVLKVWPKTIVHLYLSYLKFASFNVFHILNISVSRWRLSCASCTTRKKRTRTTSTWHSSSYISMSRYRQLSYSYVFRILNIPVPRWRLFYASCTTRRKRTRTTSTWRSSSCSCSARTRSSTRSCTPLWVPMYQA